MGAIRARLPTITCFLNLLSSQDPGIRGSSHGIAGFVRRTPFKDYVVKETQIRFMIFLQQGAKFPILVITDSRPGQAGKFSKSRIRNPASAQLAARRDPHPTFADLPVSSRLHQHVCSVCQEPANQHFWSTGAATPAAKFPHPEQQ